jgi:hypothetical protein
VVIVTAVTAAWTVQILQQVSCPDPASVQVECRTGVRRLLVAVRSARRAAAEEPGGERAALKRFRSTLQPVWQWRHQLTEACAHDADALRALREVDLLRYAEEHAVRYEAVELARRRRRIRAVEATLFGPSSRPSPGQPSAAATALANTPTPN